MAKGLIINSYAFDIIEDLDDTEKALLVDVLNAYFRGYAIPPDMPKTVRIAFNRIADDNAKFDSEHRAAVSGARHNAAKERWEKSINKCKTMQTMQNASCNSKISKRMQMMQNDANDANPRKEKNIDIDKEKDIEKISVFEERGGAGEGEAAILTEDKLARRKEIFMQVGGTDEDFYTYAVNHGWTKESPQT